MRWIWQLLRRLAVKRSPDAAWRPTGYRYTFEGYDEAKAVNAAKREHERTAKARELAQQRAGLGKSAIITDASEFERRKVGGR